jgi:enamine deaminase RidA (YjgF/YER057c/UK114 family)
MLLGCSNGIKMIETTDVYKTKSFGFSQAIVVNGLLFSSGQVGWDSSYQLTGERQFEDQVKQSFINIDKIVSAGNSSISDIIFLRFYVKGLDDSKRDIIGVYVKKYFTTDYKPATTLIGVETLARNDLMIEIEVIAKVNTK